MALEINNIAKSVSTSQVTQTSNQNVLPFDQFLQDAKQTLPTSSTSSGLPNLGLMNPLNPSFANNSVAQAAGASVYQTDSIKTKKKRSIADSLIDPNEKDVVFSSLKDTSDMKFNMNQLIAQTPGFQESDRDPVFGETQGFSGDTNFDPSVQANRVEVTPFQLFLEGAVDALQGISKQEFEVNRLIERYIDGDVSIDEVSMATTKLNLTISFATTLITTISQTFNEFTKMQI